MPPKKAREHHARKAQLSTAIVTPEAIAKRNRRHLDELERSNYTEPNFLAGDEDEDGGRTAKGRARQTVSDKRNVDILGNSAAAKKKKSTMNVRTALLYRRNLATLIEESGIATFPSSVPTYLTALTTPSASPPRSICSVCGYMGSYKCQRCALSYCDRNCEEIHAETRCEKRVL